MSTIYTDNVKTHLIDPVYNRGNYRAEFRLQGGTAYMSNLRMANLGIYGINAKKYNAMAGVCGLIRQISLMDDSTLLDQILEFPVWWAFKNYNRPNQENMNLQHRLQCNEMGNYIKENADSKCHMGTYEIRTLQTAADEASASKGWLDLREVFPILRNLQFLDTKFFKNLKVVIEFNDNVDQMLQESDLGVGTTAQPLMIADEILVDVPGFSGVQYVGIEHDRVVLPAVTIDGEISETVKSANVSKQFKIRGFENKTVGRMLIAKNSNNSATYKSGTTCFRGGALLSVANNNELLQLSVNGSQLFPFKGLVGDMRRLAKLNDVWGPCSTKPFQAGQAWRVDNANNINRNVYTQNGEQEISNMDYYGININDVVMDLQLDFDRRGVYVYTDSSHTKATDDAFSANVPENVSQNFNIFCEVYKAIKPNGNGGYTVQYV